jgi:hypothetical protein
MNTKGPTYIPRMGSLAERVLDYFRQSPDEELTQGDIAAKFEVSRGSVTACMETALNKGAVTYVQNEDLIWVYRPGKGTAAPKPNSTKADAPPPPEPTRSRRGITALPPALLDFSTLQVDRGVPLTGKAHGHPGESKWAPLFAKLSEPDTSVEFPAAWKSAVAAQATKLNVRNKKDGQPGYYMVRHTEPGKARIWRTA